MMLAFRTSCVPETHRKSRSVSHNQGPFAFLRIPLTHDAAKLSCHLETALEAFMALIFHGFKTAQGVIHRKSHYIPTVLCVGKNLKPKKLNKPPFSSWACFGLFQINAMSFNLASKSCRNASHESCSLFLATRLDYSWSEHQWVTCMCPLPLDFWPFCTDSALPGLQFSRTSQHTDPFHVYSTVYTHICIHICIYIYIWYICVYINVYINEYIYIYVYRFIYVNIYICINIFICRYM